MFNKLFLVTVAHFVGTALALKLFNFILPSLIISYYTYVAHVLLNCLIVWHTFKLTKQYFLNDKIQPERKAVFITGCDSGFGHNLAKRLDSRGFDVFATCMFPAGEAAEKLRESCSKRLKILHLDVTKEESIEKAVEFVKSNLGSSVLWAIVNNAGISLGLSAEITTLEEYKDTIDVNLYGVIRITKAFLPLLKKSKGRVINVTSIFGRVCLPFFSPYVVSKYAAVGFSDSLRQELADWGIRVISIEPELFQTGITRIETVDSYIENTFSKLNESERVDYDDDYKKTLIGLMKKFMAISSPKIECVINDLESAISLEHPDDVYSPRRNIFFRFIEYIYIMAPISIRDKIVRSLGVLVRYKKPKNANN